MPLEPGGYADKIGNRYEGHWTARQLLRLLNEDIRTVQIEPLGEDEPGIDLWIERSDGSRQGQQCKYHDGPWTLAELNGRGVLRAAEAQLSRSPSYTFALVSPATAPVLDQLCKSAHDSTENAEDFFRYQVQKIGKDPERRLPSAL